MFFYRNVRFFRRIPRLRTIGEKTSLSEIPVDIEYLDDDEVEEEAYIDDDQEGG